MGSVSLLLLGIIAWANRVPECEKVTFVSRSEWGARAPKVPPSYIGHPVNMTFIHHTSLPWNCSDRQSCIDAVKSIQNFHMDGRGWNDIGYSFLIGGDGRVYEGRGWGVVGAHTYGYNSISLAFCFIGDFVQSIPEEAAIEAAKHAIKCGVEKNEIIPPYELFGHRDAGCTECPGQALYDLIQRWPKFSRRKIPKRCSGK